MATAGVALYVLRGLVFRVRIIVLLVIRCAVLSGVLGVRVVSFFFVGFFCIFEIVLRR